MATDPSPKPRFDLVPLLVLAGVVVLALIGWRLYPVVEHWIAYQDCVGTGRTNCAGIAR